MLTGDVASGCFLCDAVEPVASPAPADGDEHLTVYADDQLVALLEPALPGVLLAPRAHVPGMGQMPGLAGAFLAALRRTVTVVQSAYGASGAMIEPSTVLAGASGHVAYRVVPTLRYDPAGEQMVPPLGLATLAQCLATALEERIAAR